MNHEPVLIDGHIHAIAYWMRPFGKKDPVLHVRTWMSQTLKPHIASNQIYLERIFYDQDYGYSILRPGLAAALEYLKNNRLRVRTLLIASLDHLSPYPDVLPKILRSLKKHGISVVVVEKPKTREKVTLDSLQAEPVAFRGWAPPLTSRPTKQDLPWTMARRKRKQRRSSKQQQSSTNS